MKPKTGFGVNASFCFKFALMQPDFWSKGFFLLLSAISVDFAHG